MSEIKKSASVFPVKFVIGNPNTASKKPPKTVVRVTRNCCLDKSKGGSK